MNAISCCLLTETSILRDVHDTDNSSGSSFLQTARKKLLSSIIAESFWLMLWQNYEISIPSPLRDCGESFNQICIDERDNFLRLYDDSCLPLQIGRKWMAGGWDINREGKTKRKKKKWREKDRKREIERVFLFYSASAFIRFKGLSAWYPIPERLIIAG